MLQPWRWIWQRTPSNWRSLMRNWRVVERHRLTRSQLERWFGNREVALVIMEACGHYWARWLNKCEH